MNKARSDQKSTVAVYGFSEEENQIIHGVFALSTTIKLIPRYNLASLTNTNSAICKMIVDTQASLV